MMKLPLCPLFICSALAFDGQKVFSEPKSPFTYLPLLGFGTWNLNINGQNTTDAVSSAIKTGYIHIDCAAAYGNQKDVGKGIKQGLKEAGKEREDIWITSKLWNDQ